MLKANLTAVDALAVPKEEVALCLALGKAPNHGVVAVLSQLDADFSRAIRKPILAETPFH